MNCITFLSSRLFVVKFNTLTSTFFSWISKIFFPPLSYYRIKTYPLFYCYLLEWYDFHSFLVFSSSKLVFLLLLSSIGIAGFHFFFFIFIIDIKLFSFAFFCWIDMIFLLFCLSIIRINTFTSALFWEINKLCHPIRTFYYQNLTFQFYWFRLVDDKGFPFSSSTFSLSKSDIAVI